MGSSMAKEEVAGGCGHIGYTSTRPTSRQCNAPSARNKFQAATSREYPKILFIFFVPAGVIFAFIL